MEKRILKKKYLQQKISNAIVIFHNSKKALPKQNKNQGSFYDISFQLNYVGFSFLHPLSSSFSLHLLGFLVKSFNLTHF